MTNWNFLLFIEEIYKILIKFAFILGMKKLRAFENCLTIKIAFYFASKQSLKCGLSLKPGVPRFIKSSGDLKFVEYLNIIQKFSF